MNANVNSPFFFETRHEGQRHAHYGRFLRLELDRAIEMTWVTAAGTKGAETIVTVDLKPRGKDTQLSLAHTGFPDEESRIRHDAAWPNVLGHLGTVLRKQ